MPHVVVRGLVHRDRTLLQQVEHLFGPTDPDPHRVPDVHRVQDRHTPLPGELNEGLLVGFAEEAEKEFSRHRVARRRRFLRHTRNIPVRSGRIVGHARLFRTGTGRGNDRRHVGDRIGADHAHGSFHVRGRFFLLRGRRGRRAALLGRAIEQEHHPEHGRENEKQEKNAFHHPTASCTTCTA